MEESLVGTKSERYEDKVAESVLLAQQLPVNSYWTDGKHAYKIKNIKLSNVALAEVTKVITDPNPDNCIYNYEIKDSYLFVSDLQHLASITGDEYREAFERVGQVISEKNIELFQKQCLFRMPTDQPFTDVASLHDEIIQLKGFQYFFYEPTDNCFRVFSIDMSDYKDKTYVPREWHFYMDSKDNTATLFTKVDSVVSVDNIVHGHKIYPITEYQFNELVKLIENNPDPKWNNNQI